MAPFPVDVVASNINLTPPEGAKIPYSVIIPARNEETLLPRCLAALAQALHSAETTAEVIVVLNRCSDSTGQIAAQTGCTVIENNAKNLATIRNAGAQIARGKILVTIDADSIIAANTFTQIAQALNKPNTVGGGVMIIPERWSLGILATGCLLIPIAVWHGISGGLFFCAKSDFDAIGGFDESLSSVEDIDFARRLKQHGRSTARRFVTLWRSPIRTSCRKFDHFGDWYFVLRPWLTWSLLKGRNQSAADKVWYDFKR